MDFKAFSARHKAQDAAKAAVRKANYDCSILASVGFGKSKVMIELAEELFQAGKIKSVLYTCDNRRLRDSEKEGFPAELEKWASPGLQRIVRCECYQTTYKWVGEKYDLWLGDEIDMAITPEYIKVATNNRFKHKILVSGTLSYPKRKVLSKIAPLVYELSGHDAEQNKVVNKTEYYLYNFRMTDKESKEYTKLTKKIKQLLKIQTPLEDKTLQFWMRKRKHFLNKLESSARHCRRLVSFLEKRRKENRIVVFCELTEQADRVCDYSFHGENEKDDMLTEFQTGAINKIAVVQKVKRGINLKKTNCGIFESLPGGSSTEFEQRSGRLKRLAVDELALIIFMLPWVKATKGEDQDVFYKPSVVQDWIKRATSNIPNIKLQILKL
jgi:superfamily II DNA or RNA helicase